ncbi:MULTISPECIES: carbohydrate kinase family protein [Leisingera]|jgi:fructokinase|uniref:carbohydrate kinase family protein n=1 Tax=Leisingera TaxID=191028 RepID=UPI001154B706|nr:MULTISPECIES: carbohydrate kinase [Leisingera]QDI76991.1 carbohydrate kinase [Leisingera aquaemixtae]
MILCCGEALIDMIPGETATGQAAYVPHGGGASFNTALALGRLGVRAGLFTGLSTDVFGQQLAQALAAAGVDTSLAVTSPRPCTLAFVHLTDGDASYSFFDTGSAGSSLTPQALPDLPDSVSALLLGGISLCNPPAADAYLALAQREAGRRPVMLDPNVRAGFSRDEAAYRARLEKMVALADIVKVSEEDLSWLCPRGDTRTKLSGLFAAGPKLILLTRGREGAEAYLPDGQVVTAAAVPVTVADTVGAGDTFNAGFLAMAQERGVLKAAASGEIAEPDLKACLRFAVRAAAVSVSRAGANPPWRAEVPE